MKEQIAVIAYDKKQDDLYNFLKEKNYHCEKINLTDLDLLKNNLSFFDSIILPFPAERKNISFLAESDTKLSDVLLKNQTVIGGLISDEIKSDLSINDIPFIDYFDNESYVLRNAYITAQGVIKLLTEKTRTLLSGKTALITGFGRIGKALAEYLRGLGMRVCVAARSDTQRQLAGCMGFESVNLKQMKSILYLFDYIFNTVPCNIFDEKDISHFRDKSIYFEIASKPYGANAESFTDSDKTYVLASFLPGKLYPYAVSENIARFIPRKGGENCGKN